MTDVGRRAERAPLPPGFGSIWTSVVVDLIGWGIVLPILPLYAEDFTDSPTVIGLLVASFSLMQLLSAPVLGRLSDRVGRKPVLVVSLAGTALGSLVMGLAPSLAWLFVGRIIDGASGGSISAAQAAVADLAGPDERPRLFGLLGAAFGIGFVAGPAIGSLAALGGDHVPFLIAAALAAGNALVATRRLPETRVLAAAVPEVPSATEEPAESISVLRHLAAVAFTATTGFAAFEATFALLGERRFGLGLAGVGVVFTLVGLAIAACQAGLVGRIVTRTGEAKAVRIGLALLAAGFVVLAVAQSWAALALGLLLLTGGQGISAPSITSWVAAVAGRERRGEHLGLQQSANALARVVGPLAGGILFEHVGVAAPSVLGVGLACLAVLALPRSAPMAVTSPT